MLKGALSNWHISRKYNESLYERLNNDIQLSLLAHHFMPKKNIIGLNFFATKLSLLGLLAKIKV